ncbi:MAG: hypothetical protein OSB21_04690 [Myxococcota bacterium]|nr:hypothetical protein [Myxococcota bacterium]
MGPRGAGKTSLAPLLANALACPLFDLDSLVEELLGEPLSQFIPRAGLQAFRRLELQTMQQLLGGESYVLACGAGLVETKQARRSLEGFFDHRIWLDIAPAKQSSRLNESPRPRLHPELNFDQEQQVLDARRRPLYQQLATVHLNADEPLGAVLKNCLAALESS